MIEKQFEGAIHEEIVADGCDWTHDEDDGDYYDTGCGHTFQMLGGTLAENNFVFCPFCGQKIQETARESRKGSDDNQ